MAEAKNELEIEIDRLKKSPYVKLAKQAENQMLRQKLYQLRSLEKRGKKIADEVGMKFEE